MNKKAVNRLSFMPTLPTMPCPSSVEVRRHTRRPTVAIPQLDSNRIGEAIFGVFRRFNYNAIDLEALIYFTMQSFEVRPESYEGMYKIIRNHIIKNFAITQGSFIGMADIHMHRLTVCYTDVDTSYSIRPR